MTQLEKGSKVGFFVLMILMGTLIPLFIFAVSLLIRILPVDFSLF
jgi:hypothetical protein